VILISQEAGSARTHGLCNAKIMKSWFEPKILFFRGRVRANPRRQDQLVPMGCAPQKSCGAGYELVPGGRINSYP